MSSVSRKVRERTLNRRDAGRIAALYQEHVAAGSYRMLRLESADYEWAAGIIGKFDNRLRTLDALHLAVVVRESLNLVTADRVLADTAKEFGIKVTTLR
jgi:predicted nucleic acid-binding protein